MEIHLKSSKFYTLTLIFTLLVAKSGICQQGQETAAYQQGILAYQIVFEDTLVKANTVAKSILPATMSLYIRGTKTRADVVSNQVASSMISDRSSNQSVNLLDYMNKKFKVVSTTDSLVKSAYNKNNYTIEYSNDTKSIQGIPCKKAVLHYVNTEISDATLYYFSTLPFAPSTLTMSFGKINGLIMEARFEYQGIKIHLLAKEVKFAPAGDHIGLEEDTFLIPDGYKRVNQDALIRQFSVVK